MRTANSTYIASSLALPSRPLASQLLGWKWCEKSNDTLNLHCNTTYNTQRTRHQVHQVFGSLGRKFWLSLTWMKRRMLWRNPTHKNTEMSHSLVTVGLTVVIQKMPLGLLHQPQSLHHLLHLRLQQRLNHDLPGTARVEKFFLLIIQLSHSNR